MNKQIIDLKLAEDDKQTEVSLVILLTEKGDDERHTEVLDEIKGLYTDGMDVIFQSIDADLIRCIVTFATDLQFDILKTLSEKGYHF